MGKLIIDLQLNQRKYKNKILKKNTNEIKKSNKSMNKMIYSKINKNEYNYLIRLLIKINNPNWLNY